MSYSRILLKVKLITDQVFHITHVELRINVVDY